MIYLKAFLMILIGFVAMGARASDTGDAAARRVAGAGQGHARKRVGKVDDPTDVSKAGWKRVLKETKQAIKDKNLTTASAGLAYYATLTFFPAVLGLATLFAAIAGPDELLKLLDTLRHFVPPPIQDILQTQLSPLANARPTALGIAALVTLAVVLWTTSGGLQNLVKATNIAYGVEESRGLVKLRIISILLSFALILIGAVIITLLLLDGSSLTRLGLPAIAATIFPFLRWPLLVVMISIALAVIYRYAPDRYEPKWSWVSWGAAAATIIWLVGTVLFFFYTQHFGNFNKSYGTFAGIIILMVWFNLSALIILVGAQVNKKLEDVAPTDTVDRS